MNFDVVLFVKVKIRIRADDHKEAMGMSEARILGALDEIEDCKAEVIDFGIVEPLFRED